MDGMLEGGRLDGLASNSELLAVLLQVGLQLGHILALENVPHCSCTPVPAHQVKPTLEDKQSSKGYDVKIGVFPATVGVVAAPGHRLRVQPARISQARHV